MRLLIVSGVVALVAALACGTSRKTESGVGATSSSEVSRQVDAKSAGDGLIVHEWGTFTSFSGSDGVRLEYRPLVDEDLPPFVLDRFLQSGVGNPVSKSQIRVRMRMETPVTYFYTNRERDVNVRVNFPDGLLTEFYPPVERMAPSYTLGEHLPLKGSSLDWGSVHLIPKDRLQAHVDDPARRALLESLLQANLLPIAEAKYHYGHARETDSAIVQVHRPKPEPNTLALAPAGDFFEKFLFYRGVGNFDLPLKLTASSDGTFELTNSGRDPIRSLFLIHADGQAIRFTAFDQVPGRGRRQLIQTGKATTIDALADAVKDALVEAGLYEKEALAMVKTWRSSWFGEAGTRLLYVLPRPITDALLPLEINPKPQETVRVLVGRMEIMTPEQESRITALVRKSAGDRLAASTLAGTGELSPKYVAPAELGNLGRLAEPALARVGAINQDPAIRAEARLLLQRMTETSIRNQ
jgi:hypothetical protein